MTRSGREQHGMMQATGARGALRGLTLTELVVAIAVFVLVMGLLGFPLFSAFGYIQKAIAQSESQRAGKRAIQQLSRELGSANYVFDLPPTGEFVSFVPVASTAVTFGLSGASAVAVDLVRYGRMLDFPWVWKNGQWTLLQPDFAGTTDTYREAYLPFYREHDAERSLNPYVLARFERNALSFGIAEAMSANGRYPLDQSDYTALTGEQRFQGALLRKLRNDLIAVTPYGDAWDVARFQARPMRVTTEALLRPVKGNALSTYLTARYPLWAARSRDIDEVPDSLLPTFYPVNVNPDTPAANDLLDIVRASFPLYPRGNAAVDAARNKANPFGYQVRIYDRSSAVVFGMGYDAGNNLVAVSQRHFMDWPPIDRPDFSDGTAYVTAMTLWTREEIKAQRDKGILVFEQPFAPGAGTADDARRLIATGAGSYWLPLPGGSWNQQLTYRLTPPSSLTLTLGGVPQTFRLVDKPPASLGANEFCLVNRLSGIDSQRKHGDLIDITTDGWQAATREIAFNAASGLNGASDVIADAIAEYTICDLQPTDLVVATYATRGMLDVGLTLARQDRSGAKLADSRQNYTLNLRIEARNAMRRVRRNQ